MTVKLHSARRAATSGTTKSVVVFVHGYGADGADLLGLADPLAPHMPDTVFIAPDAPERCTTNPAGYQWFAIPWLDGASE
ncbi:MAG: alpha/beta hydrolase, partial [Paracoccaceae bacterium]